MYYVKYGNKYIHDPRVNIYLSSCRIIKELNKADTLTFTISPYHEMVYEIKERDRSNLITVYSDETLIFKGEILTISENMNREKSVECRSELSYLNDTVLRPYSTLEGEFDRVAPSTVEGYFAFLINEHNDQVDNSKQFKIGKNEGASLNDRNNYIYRSDSTYPQIGETIKSKIIDELGGYIYIDYSETDRTINLVKEFTNKSPQIIEFGSNLLDYTNGISSEDIYTYILPLGFDLDLSSYLEGDTSYNPVKMNISSNNVWIIEIIINVCNLKVESDYIELEDKKQEYEEKLAIYEEKSSDPETYTQEEIQAAYDSMLHAYDSYVSSASGYYDDINERDTWVDRLNDLETVQANEMVYHDSEKNRTYYKDGDRIYCREMVEKYGWIGKAVVYDDLTYASNLIKNGLEDLKINCEPTITMEISAIDLSLIDDKIEPIELGDYVRIISKPHDFDSYLQCSRMELDLLKAENTNYVFGTMYQTLTGQTNKKINQLNKEVNKDFRNA